MPFESRRLCLKIECIEQTRDVLEQPSNDTLDDLGRLLREKKRRALLTIEHCPNHSCFLPTRLCLNDSRWPDTCPGGSIPAEVDPEEPDIVLLRPEHLPRLRGQLHLELAQIDEAAHRKDEIESQLEELDAAEKELKKRTG
jgi:hypothetical protein